MSKELDFNDMGNAACAFLESKRLNGLENLLGEALLVIAIAEYLVAHRWKVSVERELAKVYGFKDEKSLGYMSYDLDAECSGQNLAFEMKFLKPQSKNSSEGRHASTTPADRIADDLIKLSYIDKKDFRQFFVLGRGAGVRKSEGPEKFLGGAKSVMLSFGGANVEQSKEVKASKWFSDRISSDEFNNVYPKPAMLSRIAEATLEAIEVEIFELSR